MKYLGLGLVIWLLDVISQILAFETFTKFKTQQHEMYSCPSWGLSMISGTIFRIMYIILLFNFYEHLRVKFTHLENKHNCA